MKKLEIPPKAKKSLGQNFLTDNLAIVSIIEAINPKTSDTIVEIGPGHGELTLPLLKSGAKVIAIEKDSSLAEKLVSSLAEEIHKNQLEVIYGDALKLLPSLWAAKELNGASRYRAYKLVGNIPYYITGFLLRSIAELEPKPSSIVLTIQKEVAERICAKPGNMSLLAASVQFWGKPEIIRIIPRESFSPAPKVDSAVIRIVPIISYKSSVISQNFYSFIKVLFKQPRKTILNNLRGLLNAEEIEKTGVDPNSRPQNLEMEKIINLARTAHFYQK